MGPNPAYIGCSPRVSASYLGGLWARIRASLARQRINYAGFRVAEPHQDGTPHWHLIIYCPPEHHATIEATVRRYALAEGASDPGAQRYRIKYCRLSGPPDSATRYAAKYLVKNLAEHSASCEAKPTTATKAQSWATLWRIRQFQFFGSPPVSLWRALRRFRSPLAVGAIEGLRRLADSGDSVGYIQAMGGLPWRKATSPFVIGYRPADTINQWGDKPRRIAAWINHAVGVEPIPRSGWQIRRHAAPALGTLAITVRSLDLAESLPTPRGVSRSKRCQKFAAPYSQLPQAAYFGGLSSSERTRGPPSYAEDENPNARPHSASWSPANPLPGWRKPGAVAPRPHEMHGSQPLKDSQSPVTITGHNNG